MSAIFSFLCIRISIRTTEADYICSENAPAWGAGGGYLITMIAIDPIPNYLLIACDNRDNVSYISLLPARNKQCV